MNIGFLHPWALLLAALAIIPWYRRGQPTLYYSSLAMIPADPLSDLIDKGLRLAGIGTCLCLAMGAAGPYWREQYVDRVGTGAHIVLLIDRSSSMNENFTGRYLGARANESKSAMAQKLLSELIDRREHDLFGVIAFAAAPIYVMPLTADRGAVQAAIRASGERGHGLTHIAPGLAMALDFFSGRPKIGSRIILLVSDGAARIDDETRERLRLAFQDTGAGLYWIYLRNPTSAPLAEKPAHPNESTTPEYFLNEYFKTLDAPYRAFEAENPDAMEKAIAEIERLENMPLDYQEKLPRQDVSSGFFILAAGLLSLLISARFMEITEWRE